MSPQTLESAGRPVVTDHYFLRPTDDERQRLKLQSNLLLRVLGNIQVHAPVELSAGGGAVLESGTGSGTWLCDLAKAVPETTELIGIDIKSDLFPSPASIPPNLTFKVFSIASLPVEWTDKFTLVHQRLLFGALRPAEWTAGLNEIYRVLKPGSGWVQLFEIEEWANMGPALQSYNNFLKHLLKALGTDGFFPNGYKTWRAMLEERGFVDIRVQWYDSPLGEWAGKDGVDMKENLMGVIRGFRNLAMKYGGFGVVDGGEAEYERWRESVGKEVDEGVTKPKCRWVMICARKPSSR